MPYISSFKIKQAVQQINAGKLVVYPTEAVYGLGCDPLNRDAVFNLLTLKNRSADKGLILIASSLKQLEPYLQLNEQILSRIQASWPGPVTWIIPAQAWVPTWLTGSHSTLAVRVTAHPVAQLLCEKNGQPLVSTSVNTQGKSPATTSWNVSKSLNHPKDLFIVPGKVGQLKQATPIFNAVNYQQLR